MSNARKLADNLPREGQLGNRNLIINGAMTVAQRNTSVNEINNNDDDYWTTDRWKNSGGGSISGKVNMSQDSDAPDGYKYSTKFAVHTADTAIASDHSWRVEQHIEAGNLRHLNYGVGSTTGKKLTVSFWVKSNLTGNWSVGLYMDSTSGGTTTNNNISQTYTINAANTWEYKTLTFIPNTDTNMNSTDNDHGLRLWFHLAAGSNYTSGSQSVWGSTANRAPGHNVNFFSSTSNTWQYTGVQLEVGDTATPFEHEPISVTLAKCQRYFIRYDGNAEFVCQFYSTSSGDFNVATPVTMRTTPTLTTKDKENTANRISLYSSGYTHGHSIQIISSRSIGNIMTLRISGISSGVVGVNEAVQVQFNDLRLDAEI